VSLPFAARSASHASIFFGSRLGLANYIRRPWRVRSWSSARVALCVVTSQPTPPPSVLLPSPFIAPLSRSFLHRTSLLVARVKPDSPCVFETPPSIVVGCAAPPSAGCRLSRARAQHRARPSAVGCRRFLRRLSSIKNDCSRRPPSLALWRLGPRAVDAGPFDPPRSPIRPPRPMRPSPRLAHFPSLCEVSVTTSTLFRWLLIFLRRGRCYHRSSGHSTRPPPLHPPPTPQSCCLPRRACRRSHA